MAIFAKSDVVVVVQARSGSTRLPGKALLPVRGKPMLLFLLERLRAELPWPVLLATSETRADDALEKLAVAAGFPVVRGPEANVLARFQKAARETGASHLVRLTADNPAIDTELVRSCVVSHIEKKPDLTSTREILPDRSVRRHVPKGHSVDVIDAKALLAVHPGEADDFAREHVIPVFFKSGKYRVNIVRDLVAQGPAVSVDTKEDYEALLKFYP